MERPFKHEGIIDIFFNDDFFLEADIVLFQIVKKVIFLKPLLDRGRGCLVLGCRTNDRQSS